MERIALVALLVGLPSVALGQRVEIAPFAGRYHPLPATALHPLGLDVCDPCLPVALNMLERDPGVLVGGRISFQFASRTGLDLAFLHAKQTNELWDVLLNVEESEDVTTSFVAIQPYLRVRVDEFIELGLAVGPTLAFVSAVSNGPLLQATRSVTSVGVAVTNAVRAHLTPSLRLELRGSAAHIFGPGGLHGARNHVMYGAGLAYAFNH